MAVDLREAFQEFNMLNEDTFTIDDNGIAELKAFEIEDAKAPETEVVIDPLAETEKDLEDSYMGNVILECDICKSKIFKKPEEVVINEEDNLANEDEECPYCFTPGGFKVIGQVTEYCPHCDDVKVKVEDKVEESTKLDDIDADADDKKEKAKSDYKKENDDADADRDDKKKNLKEEIENISIETEDQKITVTSEDKESTDDKEHTDDKDEMIEPVDSETEEKFKDIDIDEFDEESFDTLGENYLKKVYDNVESFKTSQGKVSGNKLILEGIITFKSGKQGKTSFIFEARSCNSEGKVKFLGENKQFAKGDKAFTIEGNISNKKLIVENFKYNYRAKDANGESKHVYGNIRK